MILVLHINFNSIQVKLATIFSDSMYQAKQLQQITRVVLLLSRRERGGANKSMAYQYFRVFHGRAKSVVIEISIVMLIFQLFLDKFFGRSL